MAINDKFWIEKQNRFCMATSNLSLQEKRFFDVYAAKINRRDDATRVVQFTANEFVEFFEIKGKFSYNYLDKICKSLLRQIATVPRENGGVDMFPIFVKSSIYEENRTLYIEMEAHPDSLKLFFFKDDPFYFYRLENIKGLRTSYGYQLYNILKRNMFQGQPIELEMETLRKQLGIKEDQYARWSNFKQRVLDVAVRDVNEHADICCTYKKGESGTGGAWLSLIFFCKRQSDSPEEKALPP